MSDTTDIELTEREKAVAREAARMAVTQLADEFYRQVGKGVVSKALVALGLLVFGFAVAKGWITFPK